MEKRKAVTPATVKHSRRSVVATLAGGIGAGAALAACGGPTPAPASQTKAMSGPLVMWWPNATFDPTATIGGDIQKTFSTQHPGLTIESVIQGSADTFKTQVAAGTPPDFYHTQSYWQSTWGVTGLNTQLDDYVKRSKLIKPEDVWPLKLKEVQHQGKTWALPYSIDSRVIYINADHYARSGYDVNKPPATWDDLEKTIPALTKQAGPGEVSQFGFDPFLGSGGTQRWLVPFWQLGGEFHNPEGTKITINNDRGIRALEWIVKLLNMQGGWPALEKAQAGVTPAERLFLQNKASYMYATFSTKASVFTKEAPEFKFGFMDYPKPAGGKVANYAGGWAINIPKGAKNPDAAFAFIEHLYLPENDLKWHTFHLRVPVHQSVAKSVDFTRNDPFLKLTMDGMAGGRFVASIPGGEGILPVMDAMIKKVRAGQASVRDALQEGEQLAQQEVDRLKTS